MSNVHRRNFIYFEGKSIFVDHLLYRSQTISNIEKVMVLVDTEITMENQHTSRTWTSSDVLHDNVISRKNDSLFKLFPPFDRS